MHTWYVHLSHQEYIFLFLLVRVSASFGKPFTSKWCWINNLFCIQPSEQSRMCLLVNGWLFVHLWTQWIQNKESHLQEIYQNYREWHVNEMIKCLVSSCKGLGCSMLYTFLKKFWSKGQRKWSEEDQIWEKHTVLGP